MSITPNWIFTFFATMKYLIKHDNMTDLPNRLLFFERLSGAIETAALEQTTVSVLLLDVDRFKVINHSLGHTFGDRLLQEVVRRIKLCVRPQDTIARMGGDEFTIVMPELPAYLAGAVAERILEQMKAPILLDKFSFRVTVSMGVSVFPTDGLDAETLMRHADTAMYRMKEMGKNGYQLYGDTCYVDTTERLMLESELHRALQSGEFEVHYQPQVNTAAGTIVGVEALARWRHPELGLIAPSQFIPLAEETGLIIQLGELVLRAACAQNKRWQEAGIEPFRVAVNLSLLQFRQHNLVDVVEQVLRETGLEARYLELEITESMAMHNERYIMEKLQSLKELGIHISIDDFGTGYSSLGYLKKFPIDTLKIDQSFVRDITHDVDDAAIVSAVIAIARSLGIDVIAEGVELQGQLAFLQRNQCHYVQGYYFSPPVCADQLTDALPRLKEVAQAIAEAAAGAGEVL